MSNSRPQVVIVSGGFAGLSAAITLGKENIPVTIIDKQNYHLFQPLLYQVATGFLSPGDIASPLRAALAKYKSVSIIRDEIVEVDPNNRMVKGKHANYTYNYLIAATGVETYYYEQPDWPACAPGLKTVEDALDLRTKILNAFERAELSDDPEETCKYLTFVIVGGGPTGVELAGAISELARITLNEEFRKIDPRKCKIILYEGGDRILPSFNSAISRYAQRSLEALGVEVFTQARVSQIEDGQITIALKNSQQSFAAKTIIWAAGVKVSGFGQLLRKATKADADRGGRIIVKKNLSLSNYPEIFIAGDLACFEATEDKVLPGLAPVAMQQGSYLGKQISLITKNKACPDFKYRDKGSMAVIGKGRAVVQFGSLYLTGFLAWLIWAFVHIYFLIEFENRLIVFMRWGWNYVTNKRGSRLITGK